MAQACPNYAPNDGLWSAAPPLAVRKGSAFPTAGHPRESPPPGLEGPAFQPGQRKRKGAEPPGKARPFRRAGRQSRRLDHQRLLIRRGLRHGVPPTGTPLRSPEASCPNLPAYQVEMKIWETVQKLRLIILSAIESISWLGEGLSHCEDRG